MVKLSAQKVPASTLIEVLIAMVIIMIVFTLSVRVFNQVMNSGVSFQQVRVNAQLKLLKDSLVHHGNRNNETLLIDHVTYEVVYGDSDFDGLSNLAIKATVEGKTIGKLTSLFQTHNEASN